MNDLITQIYSRGYIETTFRPAEFQPDRIKEYPQLEEIINKNIVSIRGWDYPAIPSTSEIKRLEKGIGVDINWKHHKSVWRFSQSFQFYSLNGFPYDWRDESNIWPPDSEWIQNHYLGVGETICSLTEILEFLSRLSLFNECKYYIKIAFGNLQGRCLLVDSLKRSSFSANYSTSTDIYNYENILPQEEIISRSKDIALEIAKAIFQRFNWNHDSLNFLREWQNEFLH
jgi:hypothetical protein